MKKHGLDKSGPKAEQKRDKGATVLETEEAGFSAIEEEVKSPQINARPTVYAGMSAKYEKYPMNLGTTTNTHEEYFDSKSIRDPYGVDNDILDQDLIRKSNATMINQFYHSGNSQRQSISSKKEQQKYTSTAEKKKPVSKIGLQGRY